MMYVDRTVIGEHCTPDNFLELLGASEPFEGYDERNPPPHGDDPDEPECHNDRDWLAFELREGLGINDLEGYEAETPVWDAEAVGEDVGFREGERGDPLALTNLSHYAPDGLQPDAFHGYLPVTITGKGWPQNAHELDDAELMACSRTWRQTIYVRVNTWWVERLKLNDRKWRTTGVEPQRYARHGQGKSKDLLHRMIMRAMLLENSDLRVCKAKEFGVLLELEPALMVDILMDMGAVHHINHCTSDNSDENLELVRPEENGSMQIKRENRSGYRGVEKHGNAWQVRVWRRKNGRAVRVTVGTFRCPHEAAVSRVLYYLGRPSLIPKGYRPPRDQLTLWKEVKRWVEYGVATGEATRRLKNPDTRLRQSRRLAERKLNVVCKRRAKIGLL